MSEDNKSRPSHRVLFAVIKGKDQDGRNILGRAREIGAIWPSQRRDGVATIQLDHIPEEMRSRGGGMLFTRKIDELRSERDSKKRHDPQRGHSDRDRDDRR